MLEIGTSREAIIDGDILLYQCAASAEKANEGWSECLRAFREKVYKVSEQAHCDSFRVAFTGKNNFRKILSNTYKGGRKGKPACYDGAKEGAFDEFGSLVCQHENLEADDLMGIMATNGRIKNPVICSIDKDLRTIPGWHFNTGHYKYKGDEFPSFVSEQEAAENLFVQLLKGDPTDNIAGLSGVGDVRANAHLKDRKGSIVSQEIAIDKAKAFYNDEEAFSLTLSLVYIWRKPMSNLVLENPLIKEIASTIKSI